MVRLAFKATALFAHQYKLILYKLILFYMMICGSGTETTMDLWHDGGVVRVFVGLSCKP